MSEYQDKENVDIDVQKLNLQTRVTVKLRNLKSAGFDMEENVACGTTVGDLKEWVVIRLTGDEDPSLSPLFIPKAENIRVLEDASATLESLDGLPNDSALIPGHTYMAFEVFESIPCDLYRTVAFKQLEPATYCCDPDGGHNFTKLSPFYCAAMTKQEATFPTCTTAEGKGLSVSGVSLFAAADEPLYDSTLWSEASSKLPPVADKEKKGSVWRMDLETFANKTNHSRNDNAFGLLRTKFTHKSDEWDEIVGPKTGRDDNYEGKEQKAEKKRRQNLKKPDGPLATERVVYFRFVLPKGTDLRPFGAAVVFDNGEDAKTFLHFTLIRTAKRDNNPKWQGFFSEGGENFDAYFPIFAQSDCIRVAAGEMTIEECAKKYLGPSEDAEEPVTVLQRIGEQIHMLVLPKVAALFRLHDFKLVAEAEPNAPANSHQGSDAHELYEAVKVLYYIDSDETVQHLIDRLSHANYCLKKLDRYSIVQLLHAMQSSLRTISKDLFPESFLSDHDLEEDDECDVEGAIGELLKGGIRHLEEFVNDRPVSPMPTLVPSSSQTKTPLPIPANNQEKKDSPAESTSANDTAETETSGEMSIDTFGHAFENNAEAVAGVTQTIAGN